MPVGLIGNTDQIKSNFPLNDIVEPPAIHLVLAAIVQLQHNAGPWRTLPDGAHTFLEQSGKVVKALIVPALRPQHTVRDLVADLVTAIVQCLERQ